MSELLTVFVNARAVHVPQGATALDAVRAFDAAAAEAVNAGMRRLTDSRGLPVAPTVPVHSGAIFRLVSARAGRTGDAE